MKCKTAILSLLILALVMGMLADGAKAQIITNVVRANGDVDNREPIGPYDGSTPPLPTQDGGLMDGNLCFSDRLYPLALVPEEYIGSEYIRTFNEDKNAPNVTYTVTFASPCLIWITVDDRVANLQSDADIITAAFAPAGTFQDTGLNFAINESATNPERPMSIFAAEMPAGTYVFARADHAGNNFNTYGALATAAVAQNPSPEDGAMNVPVDVVLTWDDPDPCSVQNPRFIVHLGLDPNGLDNPVVVNDQDTNMYDPPGNLLYDTLYYWHIIVVDPNGGIGDPIIQDGITLSFTTVSQGPTITAQPEGQAVFPGESAMFSVDAFSNADPTLEYQWIARDPISTAETVLANGGDISGADTADLTIANVEVADGELEYYCQITNDFGTVSSDSGGLLVKIIVGRWDFEDNLFDTSLNDNHGTANGEIAFDPCSMIGMKSLFLDSMDPCEANWDYVDLGPATELDFGTGDWSVSAWVRTTRTAQQNIYQNGGDGGGGIRYQLSAGEIGPNRNFDLTVDDNSTKRQASGGPINDGKWHFVVGQRRGTTIEAYVDGVLTGTNSVPDGYDLSYTSQSNSYIGTGWHEGNQIINKHFVGNIDDVIVRNYALSDLEIAHAYTDVVPTSVCLGIPSPYDFNQDCVVNLLDWAMIAAAIADCNLVPATACP